MNWDDDKPTRKTGDLLAAVTWNSRRVRWYRRLPRPAVIAFAAFVVVVGVLAGWLIASFA